MLVTTLVLSNIVLIYLEVPEQSRYSELGKLNCLFMLFYGCMLSFNLLLFLELVKKFGVVVFKPILVVSLAGAEEYYYYAKSFSFK